MPSEEDVSGISSGAVQGWWELEVSRRWDGLVLGCRARAGTIQQEIKGWLWLHGSCQKRGVLQGCEQEASAAALQLRHKPRGLPVHHRTIRAAE